MSLANKRTLEKDKIFINGVDEENKQKGTKMKSHLIIYYVKGLKTK